VGLSQRPVQVPFLASPGAPLPQGALQDPIPATGAGAERVAAQQAAAAAGLLPEPEMVPRCPAAPLLLPSPCSTTATNFGTCSSCTPVREPALGLPELRLGLDGSGRPVFGVVGIRLEQLRDYRLSGISVAGLQATLGPPAKFSCPAAPLAGSRARASTAELLLVDCCGGSVDGDTPEPLLVRSERPAGAACKLPPGFSTAWSASGSSQTSSARPVGNYQNVQLVPAFLPPTRLCPPR